MRDNNLYRPGVGIVLLNQQGLVFMGERLNWPDAWQMPQGGIDAGEDIEAALFREMKEEIGTDQAQLLHIMEDWLYYDFPSHLKNRLFKGRYKGQQQKWAALRFKGEDHDICLDADDSPEFSRWQWLPLVETINHVVPFKREIYQSVIGEFLQYT